MTTFILNNTLVQTGEPEGMALLDFIRYASALPGTKIGCREGDCGACTVLEGTMENNSLAYKSIVSCLTPLGNAHGKHIVTIEGINNKELTPVQKAMADNAATQCGFCTPGFVMSFTAHSLTREKASKQKAIDAVSGNICRCTGYKSIERAAGDIAAALEGKDLENPVKWLVDNNFLPLYFLNIPKRLATIKKKEAPFQPGKAIIAGGTDLMVQKHDEIASSSLNLFFDKQALKGISKSGDKIIIGAAATANDIMHSEIMNEYFPTLKEDFRLVSSEPVRNMGTVAGNIVNASPIGDLSIFFLALDATVEIQGQDNATREIPLKKLFLDYKRLDMHEGEFIKSIHFTPPQKDVFFNFEKVSKRTYLDIASVNSAMSIELTGNKIKNCHVSGGGVKAIPLYLEKTGRFLEGQEITPATIAEAVEMLQEEISPISDVRGTADYKRLLMRQLFFAHFIKLFPEKFSLDKLLEKSS